MPLERYHILQNEIDPCAVKVNSLEGTPLTQQRGAQDRLFMSSLGKARPGTAVKAIHTISWSQRDNWSPFWSDCGRQALDQSQERQERRHTPGHCGAWGSPKSSTSIIPQPWAQRSCPLCPAGPGTLGRLHPWNENRDSTSGSFSSEKSRWQREIPGALGKGSMSHRCLRCSFSWPLFCRSLSC